MIDVSFFLRAETKGQHSLERVLGNLTSALAGRVSGRVWRPGGIRLSPRDILDAVRSQGDVNHINGHDHHLALVLDARRTVLTVHDLGHLSNVRRSVRLLYRMAWFSIPLARVAAVTTVSDFTRAQLVREFGLRPKSIQVIHNCVPAGFERTEREFAEECPTILVVGTARQKNAGRLVDAVAGLHCRILFVGEVSSSLREQLERVEVGFEERVNLSDDDLAGCYRESDIVYFASTYEGFGLPIVEAQTVGRPVITSTVCSMPEVAGAGALLVDPYDVAAIRDGIRRLIGNADLRAELVGKGLENVQRFGREAFAEAYLDLYRRVAA